MKKGLEKIVKELRAAVDDARKDGEGVDPEAIEIAIRRFEAQIELIEVEEKPD